jgi:hypothetical protein
MADKALWRQVFDTAERSVTPRVEALVRTSEFSKGAALTIQLRAALRSRVSTLSAKAWHTLNLPAGTDIVRIRAQLAAIDRELRRLGMQAEQDEAANNRALEAGEDT